MLSNLSVGFLAVLFLYKFCKRDTCLIRTHGNMQFKYGDFCHAFYIKMMSILLYSNACGIAVKWHTAGGPVSFVESLSEPQLELLMLLIGIPHCCKATALCLLIYCILLWCKLIPYFKFIFTVSFASAY